jgi:hypothetical protein
MSIYNATVPQYAKILRQLDTWLVKATEHAATLDFDPNPFVACRLAPNQFHLARQIQAACDTAKFAVSRLTAGTPPSHEDTETTIDELRARVAATVEYIESVDEAAFEGAGDRDIALPFAKGMATKGGEYLNAFALPNFYFHVSHTFAILRHNGVAVGKRDFLGGLNMFPIAE